MYFSYIYLFVEVINVLYYVLWRKSEVSIPEGRDRRRKKNE